MYTQQHAILAAAEQEQHGPADHDPTKKKQEHVSGNQADAKDMIIKQKCEQCSYTCENTHDL